MCGPIEKKVLPETAATASVVGAVAGDQVLRTQDQVLARNAEAVRQRLGACKAPARSALELGPI